MSDKKRQHLVPCSYMQFFSYNRDKKKTRKCNVWFLDKKKKDKKWCIWKRKTGWMFTIKNYYTFYSWQERNIEVENFLWKIEELYPDIYSKIITNKNLNYEDLNMLMFFISLQLFRTEKWEDLIIEKLWWSKNKEILRKAIIVFAGEMTKILSNDFILCLYKALENRNFLTTDTPAFWRPLPSEPLDPGWYEPFEFLFPLSSEYLLLSFHKNSNQAKKLTPEQKQVQFIECSNIDKKFMDRANYEIWHYWKHGIISKEKKELDDFIKTLEDKPIPSDEYINRWIHKRKKTWKIVFKRMKGKWNKLK